MFATIDRASGEPIGSTRYLNVREAHRSVEIGWTRLSPAQWRYGANVEAKLLMLEQRVPDAGMHARGVQDGCFNERSRAAPARIARAIEGDLPASTC